MLHTIAKFNRACRQLEREGFTETSEEWSSIDNVEFETARALHPDGSYALYKRSRSQFR